MNLSWRRRRKKSMNAAKMWLVCSYLSQVCREGGWSLWLPLMNSWNLGGDAGEAGFNRRGMRRICHVGTAGVDSSDASTKENATSAQTGRLVGPGQYLFSFAVSIGDTWW